MNIRPMIKPHIYKPEKPNIQGTHLEIIQQPDLWEQVKKDIHKALEPYSTKEVSITFSPMETYHDPKEPDCLCLKVKVYVKPKIIKSPAR